MQKLTKVNLGCGTDYRQGYINVDIVKISSLINPDIVWNIEKEKLPFETESMDEVYCSHIIEHISFYKVPRLIEEIYRILKHKGLLLVIVPDLETICHRFLNGEPFAMLEWFFGNQQHEGEYHKSGFTATMLEAYLKSLPFSRVDVSRKLNESGTMHYLYGRVVK